MYKKFPGCHAFALSIGLRLKIENFLILSLLPSLLPFFFVFAKKSEKIRFLTVKENRST